MKRTFSLIYFINFIFSHFLFSQGQSSNGLGLIEYTDTYLSRLVPFGFNGTVLISVNETILLNNP